MKKRIAAALLSALLLISAIPCFCMPAFAAQAGPADAEPHATDIVYQWTRDVAFITDYSKPNKLGTLRIGKMSSIRWYILTEDGTVYNFYETTNFPGGALDVTWTGLDTAGAHPNGSWNHPAEVRFRLVFTITDPGGETHVFYDVFSYAFYDSVNPFLDVQSSDYYFQPVLWAYYHDPQITNGTSANLFGPNDVCTRAQVVTFLWRANGKPTPGTESELTSPFVDVSLQDYFFLAVLWASARGITEGTTEKTFSPNDKCTRAQVVTFLWRAANKPSVHASNPFVDVSSSSYAYQAVLWAVKNGITTGTDETHFSPAEKCTRGQVVTFLCRAMG